ncbi:MAG: putative toxin-antitoxin system toxin component, PIN family [Candidatus Altiarchaeales archaeon WOR_SM1_86-2]|nr:MAG: putative toxin-antitoxin system toxin component, PIN family [Candidatus Altiarchaeales archaeon WOR_SM1_86-2]ODS39573.1 MAG: putative toxin-antitoxin system toxin component, PIN family [Candidatus Altiarchaeales archaeon WOR_SM1_79]
MKIVVLDTNILISATFWDGNESKLIEKVEEENVVMVTSPEILDEFRRTLAKDRFPLTSEEIDDTVSRMSLLAMIIHPQTKVNVVKDDLEDNKFLECALDAGADFIVSGDRHLLDLKIFKGIKIVKCKKFLEIFGN